jgi:RNA polymerase sigma factor (sigma-70 family)
VISEPSRAVSRYLSELFRNGTSVALSDAELLNRFASRRSEHDEAAGLAFAALLARHGPMVLRVCRAVLGDRHEVEDAFQATFLVLAVRARSIRRHGSVASWLHGVALRVAGSERSRAARRRRHELDRAAMTSATTQDAGSDLVCDHELTLVIQEEIGRLPEKYQAAVVLCYLQGLTYEMAAERLGWPVGSVKSRLAWARERLRVRLTRRGVAPTTLPFDRSGSSRDAEPAPSPLLLGTRLADATLRGALKAGMGKGALIGVTSAEAIALTEGIIKSMANARMMLMATAAFALVVGMVTAGAGGMRYSAVRQEKRPNAGITGQETRQAVENAQVTQGSPRPAATDPATDQGPFKVLIQVADAEGRRLSGADVAASVSYVSNAGSLEPFLERTRTDADGQVPLEFARERSAATVWSANVWAYQPGRAIAVTSVSFARKRPSPIVIPLTLDQPANCTITVVGPDDRPIAGLRLTPRLLRRTDRRMVPAVPGAWQEPLAATTDAKGVATLTYLPKIMVPLSIRIAGPGVAPHSLPLDMAPGRNAILKLGRSGRVVGIVRTASGVPLANVPVELWVQGADIRQNNTGAPGGDRRMTLDEMIRLDQEPLKTGAQGAFQTPSNLLAGSTYRVSIRQDGFVPFVSDWVTLNGERATIPHISLQPLQKLSGQIQDRQGQAVGGAQVFLPAGGPATTTDALGRFAMVGINPGKAVMLVEKTGFRLQGRLVDPLSQTEVDSITLTRTSEAPGPGVKPLADPIPPEESRALADRLLEPYLHDAIENDNAESRLAAILALSEYDLDRAIELFQNGKFRDDDRLYRLISESIAAKLAAKDLARAEAMVESIADPATKASAYTRIAKALPASERGRKRALMEQATNLLRDRLQRMDNLARLQLVSAIAEQWLDMGERDRARLLLRDEEISNDVLRTGNLGQLARLDPKQAMEQWQKQPTRGNSSQHDAWLTAIALQIATEYPADAERFLNMQDGRDNRFPSNTDTLQLCRRLARVDPTRARRIAASLSDPGMRACSWAYVALGLAEKDKRAASEAMDRAIQEIDRMRESGPVPEPDYVVGGVLLMYPSNPAAVILPVVERIAPERLSDVFWRAVALHPRIKTNRDDHLQRSSSIGFECTLLARYDRQVAAALLEPIASYIRSLATRTGPRDQFEPSAMTAMACIDPRSAVALLESLTLPRDFAIANPVHQARIRLAELLGLPREKRWIRLWGTMFARLDD